MKTKIWSLFTVALLLSACSGSGKGLGGKTYFNEETLTFTLGGYSTCHTENYLSFTSDNAGIYRGISDGNLSATWNFTYILVDDNITITFYSIADYKGNVQDRVCKGSLSGDMLIVEMSDGCYPHVNQWSTPTKMVYKLQK